MIMARSPGQASIRTWKQSKVTAVILVMTKCGIVNFCFILSMALNRSSIPIGFTFMTSRIYRQEIKYGCEELITQLTEFGQTKHDDLADAFAIAINNLMGRNNFMVGFFRLPDGPPERADDTGGEPSQDANGFRNTYIDVIQKNADGS